MFAGQNSICTLDILSCAGLVNYFGKNTELTELSVNPILLQKGSSRLALYGFGHIKDQRLYRLFDEGKVCVSSCYAISVKFQIQSFQSMYPIF